jgi:C-terminal processing protease CtpA/Prc
VDYMNRDEYWNREKSLISGDGDDSSVAVEETLLCIEYTVQAPKGKLGLTLQTSDEGCPTVCKIQPTSPLYGKVRVGDRLHSVDGRDVSMVLSDTVARIIASRENHENRTLVFGRPKR